MRRSGFADLDSRDLLKELHKATVSLQAMPVESLATEVWRVACNRQHCAFQAWWDYLFDRSCQKGTGLQLSAA
jgi:hypothetical protein